MPIGESISAETEVTDGYGAYRKFNKRQRCLAHLIRKGIALAGGLGAHFGAWLLREVRGLIHEVAEGAGAKYKLGGNNDLFLVPLGNALAEARKIDKAVTQALGENANLAPAVIIADETTPWRILVEVFVTLGQSEFNKYHLMLLQGRSG